MNTITRRLTAGFAAILASTITLGSVAALFSSPTQAAELEKARRHLPGGAGVAERYRAMQPTASDVLLAPRAGVTALRPVTESVALR
jgi:hypothetical protein